MKIISINTKNTLDMRRPAFNVDAQPEPGVMERVRLSHIQVNMKDGLLVVQIPKGEGIPQMDHQTIDTVNRAIKEAESSAISDAEYAALDRSRMLEALSKNTQLALE
jgi:hypothetical protein